MGQEHGARRIDGDLGGLEQVVPGLHAAEFGGPCPAGYLETVVVNRSLALLLEGMEGAPVELDGSGGIAIEVLSTVGTSPIEIRNLTLMGQTGIRADVPTRLRDLTFVSIGGVALDLDGGTHWSSPDFIDTQLGC